MTETVPLADHIHGRAEAILAVWRATVGRVGDVPEAEKLTYTEFVDHIPQLLDRLADRLRGGSATAVPEGKKHGQIRWRQGYDISEIVNEYGHLRTALGRATAEFARQRSWDIAKYEGAIEAINDVLDEATAESVRQFQEDAAAEARRSLAELKSRQAALEDAWIRARVEQAKLRTILDHLPAAVWVVDAEGTVVDVNDEATRLHGLARGDLVGRVNVHRLGQDFRVSKAEGGACPPAEYPLIRALRGEVVTQEEFLWSAPDGDRILSINAAPLRDASGGAIGAVAVFRDITGRRRLEADLALTEARFRSIVEKSPVLIWRSGLDGRLDYFNQTWHEFTGRAFEQERGDGWAEGIHPDDREPCLSAYRGAFARREPFEVTYRFRRHDGVYRWMSGRGTPYDDGKGNFLGFLGSCIDITERVEFEAALEVQREQAEEASRHKSRLVAALSHDARTPLNAVVLAAQLLELHFNGDANAEVQECLRTIRNSVHNVLDLLGDLLNLSKIDAGASPAEVSRFPLGPVLDESLSSIETQARLKGIVVRVEPGELAGVSLETDRSKLKQILCNLFSNALRYTDRGYIRVFGGRTADRITLSVEDSGVGIAPEDQARIFDEFTTIDSPGHGAGEGTGLGLAICRRLAQLLKGEITLRSEPGRGSTFTLSLPASVLTLSQPDLPSEARVDSPASGAILVAEDHPESRQTLAKVLRRMGYRVLEADNGRDALAILREERPLAVLMDVNMPVMDGVDATLAIRADARLADLPVFALTGDVTVENQQRIGEAGVDGYLEKPVTWELLRQALGSLNHGKSHPA